VSPTRAAIAAWILVLASGARPAAQFLSGGDAPRGGSWEAAGGGVWSGNFTGPTLAAELTRNPESSGGFDLFSAAGTMTNGAGAGATLAYYVSRALALEAGLRYSQPRLSYRLTGDAEDAADVTAEETLSRYVFTGSIVLHLRPLGSARRLIPFVAGGGGYIRELHQGNELVETGTEIHATGGVKYWFGTGRRKVGVRGEAGVSVGNGGFDFRDDGSRTLPIASASLMYLF
jgi:hypothetical protein